VRTELTIVQRKRKDRKGKRVWYIVGPGVGRHGISTRTTDRDTATEKLKEERAKLEQATNDASRLDDQPIRRLILEYCKDPDVDDVRFVQKIMTVTRTVDNKIVVFGDLRVSDLTSEIVQDWARAAYPKAKPQTLNRQFITPLLAAINYNAGRRRCARIKLDRFEAAKKAKKVAVDMAWMEAFVRSALARKSDNLAAMEVFMMTTGARRGSCFKLMPEHLDLTRGTALLVDTKTGEDVEAQLPDQAIAILRTLPLTPGQPVFGIEVDQFGKPPKQFYREWRAICRQADIPYVPPHQAGRHSFATFMIVEQGADPWTVAKLAGWKGTSMLNEYVHARGNRQVVQDAFRNMDLGLKSVPLQISAPKPPHDDKLLKNNE
jgi:integrase